MKLTFYDLQRSMSHEIRLARNVKGNKNCGREHSAIASNKNINFSFYITTEM